MRHRDSCECDACWNRHHPFEAKVKRQEEERKQQERIAKCKKAVAIMNMLNIESYSYSIDVLTLYDIFMDDEKCTELIGKLKNKAFW